MQKPPSHSHPEFASRGTATSSRAFVETIEHSRFVEFYDACRHFRYIGLCYGPPGIGKTLSAVRYSRADQIVPRDRWTSEVTDDRPVDTLLYTTSVVNTPSRVENDIKLARERVMSIVLDPIRREATMVLEEIRLKDEKSRREIMNKPGSSPCDRPAVDPTYFETYKQYQAKQRAVSDPTTLILVDEADRLQMNSLEQMRSIFDEGTHRYGADRHARHREAHSPISAVLFAYWFRPGIPSLGCQPSARTTRAALDSRGRYASR
jgi:AAA domain